MNEEPETVSEIEQEIKRLEKRKAEKLTELARALCPYKKGERVRYLSGTFEVLGIEYMPEGNYYLSLRRIAKDKKGKERFFGNAVHVASRRIPLREEWLNKTQ